MAEDSRIWNMMPIIKKEILENVEIIEALHLLSVVSELYEKL